MFSKYYANFIVVSLMIFFSNNLLFAQDENSFITIWQTDAPQATNINRIYFPASGQYSYSWEEVENPINSGSGNATDAIIIEFPNPGTYRLKIVPEGENPFHQISFYANIDNRKLIDIEQWGEVSWSSFENAFDGCQNLTISATDIPDLSNVTNMSKAFRFTNISTILNINDWDVSNVENMKGLFESALFDDDISSWNVSNVVDMERMFFNNQSFNQDIGTWDVSNVVVMESMFFNNRSFNQDIGAWDVSSVSNMNNMFSYASTFNQDLNNWDVSSVRNMRAMFEEASSFNQNLDLWNLNSLRYATLMFDSSGMDCYNYSATLYGWANNPNTPSSTSQNTISLGAHQIKYTPNIENERDYLIDELGWAIEGDIYGNCVFSVENKPFITVWKTDLSGVSNNNEIYIPAFGEYSYSWEEVGNSSNNGSGSTVGPHILSFPHAGTYRLKITPIGENPFHHIEFNYDSDRMKLQTIEQWGDIEWSSFENAFFGCINMTISTTDIPNLNNVTNMSNAFKETSLTTIPHLDLWNMAAVENMTGLFYDAANFNHYIGSWDTSSVENMSFMFRGALNFNQDIGAWDVSNVNDMRDMFNKAISFNHELGRWDVSNVRDMSNMFLGTIVFNTPIMNWDVSSVESMSGMFYNAANFNQDIGPWDLIKIETMETMFNNSGMDCMNYSKTLKEWSTKPDLPNGIILGAGGKEYSVEITNEREYLIDDLGWEITGDTLGDCLLSEEVLPFITVWRANEGLNSQNNEILIPAYGEYTYSWIEIGNPSNFGSGEAIDNHIITFPNEGNYRVKMFPTGNNPLHQIKFDYLTTGDTRRKILDVEQWGDVEWSSFERAFFGCIFLEVTALDTPDLSNVTNMSYAFARSNIVTIPHLNEWDVSNVEDMTRMFWSSLYFNENIGDWDVSNVKIMKEMFDSALAFNHDIGNWDVSNVENMELMFNSAEVFDQDISTWDVSNVELMKGMFKNAKDFNQNINSWDVSNVKDMSEMFNNAYHFNQNVDSWDVSNVENMSNMFKSAIEFNQNLSLWNLNNLQMAEDMLSFSAIDCENYSATLYGWSENPNTASDITFRAWNMMYSSDIISARNYLINYLNWTIINDIEGNCTISDESQPFITLWDTSNSGNSELNQIHIPANGQYTYSWQEINNPINKGEGEADGIHTITFPNYGVYRLKITPSGETPFHHIEFDNSGDRLKLIEIEQWGGVVWSSFKNAFYGCANMDVNTHDKPILDNVNDMTNAFSNIHSAVIPFINEWEIEGIQNMKGMFKNSVNFNQDIIDWNVSNVENMEGIFSGASSFNQDLGNWNLNELVVLDNMLDNSGLDCEKYSATLYGWYQNPNTPNNISLGAEGIEYSINIEEERNHLINHLGWTILGDDQGSCEFLSVDDFDMINIQLYPNPANQKIFILGLKGESQIKIHDINGRVIFNTKTSQSEIMLDVSILNTGVYFVNISDANNNSITKKLIKK